MDILQELRLQNMENNFIPKLDPRIWNYHKKDSKYVPGIFDYGWSVCLGSKGISSFRDEVVETTFKDHFLNDKRISKSQFEGLIEDENYSNITKFQYESEKEHYINDMFLLQYLLEKKNDVDLIELDDEERTIFYSRFSYFIFKDFDFNIFGYKFNTNDFDIYIEKNINPKEIQKARLHFLIKFDYTNTKRCDEHDLYRKPFTRYFWFFFEFDMRDVNHSIDLVSEYFKPDYQLFNYKDKHYYNIPWHCRVLDIVKEIRFPAGFYTMTTSDGKVITIPNSMRYATFKFVCYTNFVKQIITMPWNLPEIFNFFTNRDFILEFDNWYLNSSNLFSSVRIDKLNNRINEKVKIFFDNHKEN